MEYEMFRSMVNMWKKGNHFNQFGILTIDDMRIYILIDRQTIVLRINWIVYVADIILLLFFSFIHSFWHDDDDAAVYLVCSAIVTHQQMNQKSKIKYM